MDVGDITQELLARWTTPAPVSSLQLLHQHLHQPLSEELKIPVSKNDFDRLRVAFSKKYDRDSISAEDLRPLFRVSEDECALEVYNEFSCTIMKATLLTGTEDSFHGTYDLNISSILLFILSNSTHVRNTNRDTSTALKRPDSSFVVDNYCLLRGEEKGSNAGGDPNKELVQKILRWDYEPLKWILGLLWIY